MNNIQWALYCAEKGTGVLLQILVCSPEQRDECRTLLEEILQEVEQLVESIEIPAVPLSVEEQIDSSIRDKALKYIKGDVRAGEMNWSDPDIKNRALQLAREGIQTLATERHQWHLKVLRGLLRGGIDCDRAWRDWIT